jgi:hypothetical protein
MLAIILLQAQCVQDLSITELFHRMHFGYCPSSAAA